MPTVTTMTISITSTWPFLLLFARRFIDLNGLLADFIFLAPLEHSTCRSGKALDKKIVHHRKSLTREKDTNWGSRFNKYRIRRGGYSETAVQGDVEPLVNAGLG